VPVMKGQHMPALQLCRVEADHGGHHQVLLLAEPACDTTTQADGAQGRAAGMLFAL
jgi:hypothetical protein